MICPRCGSSVSIKKNKCDGCGEDITIYKKIVCASNSFYNLGLSKAKVRDLSGAIISLKKSLQLNKKNTLARNLLGLVYFEMGESVSALTEWVISKHFQEKDNDADEYISAVQSNPSKLETLNQAVKKYNSALISAKQGNDDLAIIQLKKVVSLNPRFIRAYHLLILLYLQKGEKEKAAKSLYKVKKIDVNNTTTLKYLEEVGIDTNEAVSRTVIRKEASSGKETITRKEPESFTPISSYREERPNRMLFINLIFGIILGFVVTWYLVVPTINKNKAKQQVNDLNTYNEKIVEQNAKIKTLQDDKTKLNTKIKDLKAQIEGLDVEKFNAKVYNTLFKGVDLYIQDKKTEAAKTLLGVDEKVLDSDTAVSLYNTVKDATFKDASAEIYKEGNKVYNSYKYDEAKKLLQTAFELDPENVSAIYFLGRTYHQLGDTDKAKLYYEKVIDEFPDSTRATEAKARLSTIR